MKNIGFFGVRSPLIVDLEETCHRLGYNIEYGVSVTGTPRISDMTKVVDLEQVDAAHRSIAVIPCAFSPQRRQSLYQQAEKTGFRISDCLVDPTAILPRTFRADFGGYVNAGVVIGGVTTLGLGVLINRNASVGHHCQIDDFVSIGPGAVLAGNIRVGAKSVIGAGAVIQPDVRIGKNVVVAAGTVVRKNVPDNSLISGNPGKILKRKPLHSTLDVPGGE